jgi:hypothetical protein
MSGPRRRTSPCKSVACQQYHEAPLDASLIVHAACNAMIVAEKELMPHGEKNSTAPFVQAEPFALPSPKRSAKWPTTNCYSPAHLPSEGLHPKKLYVR